MKVVFLDVDGVLNNEDSLVEQGIFALDPNCLQRLGSILWHCQAKIVISSSWRLYPKFNARLMKALEDRSLHTEVVGQTEDLGNKVERCVEIKKWLAEHPEVTRYAILDDDPNACEDGMDDSFFVTKMRWGLTDQIANAAIAYLNS